MNIVSIGCNRYMIGFDLRPNKANRGLRAISIRQKQQLYCVSLLRYNNLKDYFENIVPLSTTTKFPAQKSAGAKDDAFDHARILICKHLSRSLVPDFFQSETSHLEGGLIETQWR